MMRRLMQVLAFLPAYALAGGCVPEREVEVTYDVMALGDFPDDAITDADAWERIGIYRTIEPGFADIHAATVEWYPASRMPVDGQYQPWDRRILISDRLKDPSLAQHLMLVINHELGHAILKTGQHTTCGVMGATESFLCDEDIALACSRIPRLSVCHD